MPHTDCSFLEKKLTYDIKLIWALFLEPDTSSKNIKTSVQYCLENYRREKWDVSLKGILATVFYR